MTTISRARRFSLFLALLVLPVLWFAAPHASQDANDGFILFTSDRDNPSNLGICTNCEDIYVMAPDGTDARRLTHGGGAPSDSQAYNSAGADWSHSKKLIAFQSNRLNRIPQIFLMTADGSDQQLLVSLAGGGAFPSFSQNGNELCFHGQARPRDIYLVNVHGLGLTNLTSPGQPGQAGDNIRCDWSPKGNGIAFVSTRDTVAGGVANEEIYAMSADGSEVVRLTNMVGADTNPVWSPKGDRIAFESNRDGSPEIYVMDADGSNPVRLTNFDTEPTPSNVLVTKATWSPTGDRIAFHRRVGPQGARGHAEVYTMNADGTDVRQITFTTPPGFSGFPSWGKWSAQRR
jgi:Tol biopolymer transport system component